MSAAEVQGLTAPGGSAPVHTGAPPPLLVLPHAKCFAYPLTPDPLEPWRKLVPGVFQPAAHALTTPFASDAHTVGYVCSQQPHRLKKEALQDPLLAGPNAPAMFWFFVDVDGPAHRLKNVTDPAQRAQLVTQHGLWLAIEHQKLATLLAATPGAFVYLTRGGFRIVYRIAPRPCDLNWPKFYSASLDFLESTYGIVGDRACAPWSALFRLPHATRDPALGPEQLPTFGNPTSIGFWTFTPAPGARQPTTRRGRVTALSTPGTPLPGPGLLEDAFSKAGLLGHRRGNFVNVQCLWVSQHSAPWGGPGDSSTVISIPTTTNPDEVFVCKHAHCVHRTRTDVLQHFKITPPKVLAHALSSRIGCAGKVPSGAVPLSAVSGLLSAAIQKARAQPGTVMVITVTPGAGKSRAALADIAQEGEGLIAVPTHALGEQHQTRLESLGAKVQRRVGIGSARYPDRSLICQYPKHVERLAQLGIPGRFMCPKCNPRFTCPAFNNGASAASATIQIITHGLLPQHLLDPVPPRFVVIDEPPPPTFTVKWERPRWLMRNPEALDTPTRTALIPLLVAVADAIDTGVDLDSVSLEELLRGHGTAASGLIQAMVCLSFPRWDPGWAKKHAEDLRRSANGDSIGWHLRKGARSQGPGTRDFEIAQALWSAARSPTSPFLFVTNSEVVLSAKAPWGVAVGEYTKTGRSVVILDATADATTLVAAIGQPVATTSLTVLDMAPWKRRVVFWGNAPRLYCLRGGRAAADKLIGPLRRIAQSVLARGTQMLALFTYKILADELRAWLAGTRARPAWVPAEFDALCAAGLTVSIGHFGGLRGLNDWETFDHFAVLGDPRLSVSATDMASTVLQVDAADHSNQLALAELEQAFGRARTPSNPCGGLIEYFGTLTPSDAQWATATVCSMDEDPKAITGAQLRRVRSWLRLPQKKAASALGVTPQAWASWEKQERIPPGRTQDVLLAIARIGPGATAGVFLPTPFTTADLDEAWGAFIEADALLRDLYQLADHHPALNVARLLVETAVKEYEARFATLVLLLTGAVFSCSAPPEDLVSLHYDRQGTIEDLDSWMFRTSLRAA